jgi:hypothetical protein
VNLLWGSVAFGNPCLNIWQCARWLEDEGFNCCPALHYASVDSLHRKYERSHGVELDWDEWAETLIRIAIPYARRRVLVMAADRSAITGRVRMEARKRQISIDVVPLTFIAAETVTAIRNQLSVYPLDADASQWPQGAIDLLGSSDAYSELLPSWIRSQAVENG